jgi:hypothetical protein
MAEHLLGWPGGLVVCDVRPEATEPFVARGARAVATPTEVAAEADVISVMVRDDAQVTEVLTGTDGILSTARPGTVVAIHSTVEADTPARLAAIAADERGAILFEAPTRLSATLRDLAAACGDDRPGAVCRELTKLHEQVVRGPLGALAARAADGTIPARGELVIVVGWGSGERARTEAAAAADDALVAARAEVERLTGAGVPRGEAAKRVAAATGIPRRALYGGPDGR